MKHSIFTQHNYYCCLNVPCSYIPTYRPGRHITGFFSPSVFLCKSRFFSPSLHVVVWTESKLNPQLSTNIWMWGCRVTINGSILLSKRRNQPIKVLFFWFSVSPWPWSCSWKQRLYFSFKGHLWHHSVKLPTSDYLLCSHIALTWIRTDASLNSWQEISHFHLHTSRQWG